MDTFQIAKLDLVSGDILVVRANVPLEPMTVEQIKEYFTPYLPSGVRLLVTDPTFDLSVLTPASVDYARITRDLSFMLTDSEG